MNELTYTSLGDCAVAVVNVVCLMPLPLNCSSYCAGFPAYPHTVTSSLYFQNKTYGTSILSPVFQPYNVSYPGELLWLRGKEHCNGLVGANKETEMSLLAERTWKRSHYQKRPLWPGLPWLQQVSSCLVDAQRHPHQHSWTWFNCKSFSVFCPSPNPFLVVYLSEVLKLS
jgi:hypothetical protein